MCDAKVIEKEVIYKGRILYAVKELIEVDEKKIWRETVEHPGAVAIVAFVNPDEIVLVKQYRRAARQHLWELPAGTIENEEPPLDCAIRELQEETGFSAKHWVQLGEFFAAPGFCTEKMTIFMATDLMPGEMNLDHDESIETKMVSFADMVFKAQSGKLEDAKTLIGLLWAEAALRNSE